MTAPTGDAALIQAQATVAAQNPSQAQAAVAAYLANAATSSEDADPWYDIDTSRVLVRQLADIADSFSVTMGRDMDGFIADTVAFVTGKKFRAQGVRRAGGLTQENGVRRDVSSLHVFQRVTAAYRYAQSLLDTQFVADADAGADSPTELTDPLDAAIDRAKRITATNVQLAGRNQARFTMRAAGDKIEGYRRLLHPELAHGGDCGLCIAASPRVYHVDHLMPMHPGCHCIPIPVAKGNDLGEAINEADLASFYAETRGETLAELRQTRFRVDEHGEIGPVLRPADEPIRSAAEARRARRDVRPKTPAEQARTLRARRDALERAMRKVAAGQTPEPWRSRVDGVAARIARLDRDIVRLGG